MIRTIQAVVVNGRLQFEESLADLEGQQVTLTVATQGTNGAVNGTPQQPIPVKTTPTDEEGPEPPEWLDVEKDLYFPMPMKWEIVPASAIVEGGRVQPTPIFPEDIPLGSDDE